MIPINWKLICKKVVSDHMSNVVAVKLNYSDVILKDFIKKDPSSFKKSHILKVMQMKIGLIWQSLLGHVEGVEDLGNGGHPSKVDLFFYKNGVKYIIEIKNSLKTDNSSAKTRNMQKLQKFTKNNIEYVPIYGIINCRSAEGQDKIFNYEGVDIRIMSGRKFLDFILGNQYDDVVNSFKLAIAPYMKKM